MKRAAVATISASPNVNLSSALRAVTARVRVQRALEAWVLLTAAVCAALIARALLNGAHSELSGLTWTLAGVGPLAGAALWSLRPVPVLPVARTIDRALAAPDLISSAVSFAALPADEQTPFMRICVAQAEQASARLVPSRALSLQRPRALPALCALALWLIGLSHGPSLAPVATLATRPPAQPALDADTAAAFANELDALKAQPLDPEAAELVAKLNALLEGIAAGTIDRAQALAELRRLEEKLQSLLANDPKALETALEQIGRALGGVSEAKPLEKALSENWPEAAQELKRLSERVAAGRLNAEAEQRLAKSLERAAGARATAGQQAAIDEAKRELDRLLRKQEEQRAQGGQQERQERDERLLKRKQRELDELEREQEQSKSAERELDRLQRELDAASKALSEKDKQAAADSLQNAAKELERAARQQQSRNQAGRLAEQLAQLRAEIAQRGQAGQAGQAGQDGQSSSGDPSDGGSPIPLSAQRFGRMAQGNPSGGEGQQGAQPGGAGGQQQQGAGQGQQPGETGSGERLAQLRQGASAGAGQAGDKSGLLEQSGTSNEQGRGDGAGLGGKPQSGPATAGSGQHVDTRIEGEKRGGPSRSEVIFESGQRGFADEGYAKVHDDYVRHAESVLEREHIPGGYRYYVRRYFQLIRPRENARDGTQGAAP